MATAVKSFTTLSADRPSADFNPVIENSQPRLVMRTRSPEIGAATAIAPVVGRRSSGRSARYSRSTDSRSGYFRLRVIRTRCGVSDGDWSPHRVFVPPRSTSKRISLIRAPV